LLLPLTFGIAAGVGDHPALEHVLGRAVRRSVTSILFQHTGRAVVGRHDVRRLSDGARRQTATALATAFGSGGLWALVGVILITFLASWVAQVALAFGPAEYFAVYFLAFASFVGMGGAAPIKTVVALGLGFAIAAVASIRCRAACGSPWASTNW